MTTYLAISLPFLLVAGVGGLLLRRRAKSARYGAAVAITIAVLVVLTAIFDNLMIGADLFTYPSEHLLGPRIGLAPIEDFAYPVAAALVLPALWLVLRRRQPSMGELLRTAVPVSRPISWINTAYPFGAALLLTTREVDWLLVLGVIYYLIPYNLAMYGINDVYDYESDLANPRKGGIEGALLKPLLHRGLLWLVVATNLPFLVVLYSAGGPATWLALTVSTFAVVSYSAKGLRFKERPVIDSLNSAVHFVSPAVVGLTLGYSTLGYHTAGGASFGRSQLLLLVAFLMWGMAAQAFGAVQDIAPDREAGIGSVATAFGATTTVRLSLVLWAAAGVLMLFTSWPGPLAALVVLPYLINAWPYRSLSDERAGESNRAWRRFIWMNYGSGFVVTMVLIAVWFAGS